MSAHNFENNVQQKMGELKLVPSEAVWKNVEGNIRQQKRRRRVIFFLSFILLVGMAGGSFLLQNDTLSTVQTIEKSNNNDSKNTVSGTGTIDADPAVHSKQDRDNRSDLNKSGDLQDPIAKTGKAIVTNPVEPAQEISRKLTVRENITSEAVKSTKKAETRTAKVTTAKQPQINSPRKATTTNSQLREPDSKTNGANPSFKTMDVIINNEGIAEKSQLLSSVYTEQSLTDAKNELKPALPLVSASAHDHHDTKEIQLPDAGMKSLMEYTSVKKDIERKKSTMRSPWHFGFIANVGLSKSVTGGLLNAFEKSLIADAASFNSGLGLPGPVNLQSRAPLLSPAPVQAGPSFAIGAFVERKMTKRISIGAALQYNQFSTRSKIGYRIDSTLFVNNSASVGTYSRFYQNAPNQNYTSRYHFVELPLNLQFRLTKENKLPVYINGSLSLGYMVGTNALHYDGSYGLYYADDKLFRKWQVGLSTGLSVRLFSSSKHSMEFGPQLHFKPSNNFSVNGVSTEHLFNAGLSLKWYLK